MLTTSLPFFLALVAPRSHAMVTKRFHVPVFSVEELEQGSRSDELAEILATTGLLSIVGSPNNQASFQQTRRDGLLGLCECLLSEEGNNEVFHAVKGVDSAVLSDGTKRTTIATATVGSTPLELPRESMGGCASSTIHLMERMRDQVAWTSHAFVSALDKLLLVAPHASEECNKSKKALLRSSRGKFFHSLQSIVNDSQNLEHFHVYEQSEALLFNTPTEDNAVLDVHTDAGIFLAFVPGGNCGGNDDEGDFYMQHPGDGSLQRAIFAPGSVGVMLGVGAEHWLQTSVPLKATRHAVRMEPGHSRAWYGMSKYCH